MIFNYVKHEESDNFYGLYHDISETPVNLMSKKFLDYLLTIYPNVA